MDSAWVPECLERAQAAYIWPSCIWDCNVTVTGAETWIKSARAQTPQWSCPYFNSRGSQRWKMNHC